MKKIRQSRNVWHEASRRRGCREGIVGVMVRRPDGEVWEVWSSHWASQPGRILVLDFADGSTDLAAECELESRWPAPCCRPCGPTDQEAKHVNLGARQRPSRK